MRRFFATLVMAAIGTTTVGVGIALAGDVDVTPEAPEEGNAELTIDVSDFDPDTPVYAVPCEIPAAEDELDVTTDSCDITQVATATTDADGTATIVVDWNIPSEGLTVYVSDESRSNVATQILTPAVDASDRESESDTPEVAVLGTTVVQEDLADTGPRQTMILLMVAALAIGLGFALRSVERLQGTA